MARIQTRRSVSISGPTYTNLKAYAQSSGQTMSGIVEMLIRAHLGGTEVQVMKSEPKVEPEPVAEVVEEPAPEEADPSLMERGALIRFAVQREAERRREAEREAQKRREELEEQKRQAAADPSNIFTF